MKTAIILFNLGGPDRPEAVKPFLFNLFHDPAIIGVPQPMRWALAKLISSRRAPVARDIYSRIGGASPILKETQAQAEALEKELGGGEHEYRAFIAMRYWHPFSREAAAAVKEWGAERVILLPLYPQFSTTTTGSSVKDWHAAAKAAGLTVPTVTVCCYFDEPAFISAHAETVAVAVEGLRPDRTRILFSAHGLPEKIVKAGDPYQWQVQETVSAIIQALGTDADHQVCYQSRVGPLKWIGPSTDAEIERAGRDGKAVVLVPIAFVSEHSETLVELDIEYRHLAEQAGVTDYRRVPALGVQPAFIRALARVVKDCGKEETGITPGGNTTCPAEFCKCARVTGR